MSAYNGARYVTAAIDSILMQTLRDFEFVIIDDGSTDGVGDLLREYNTREPKIRLLVQENQGLTKSLNNGVRIACGQYLARMDADDVARPTRLESQLEFLEKNRKVVAVGADVDLLDPTGYSYGRRVQPSRHDDIVMRLVRGDGAAMVHPVVMFRMAALRQVGGYDEDFAVAQDLDLYLRLSEIGELANLPEVLLGWRQHEWSINRTKADGWQAVKRLAIMRAIERRGAKGFAQVCFPHSEGLSPLGGERGLARLTYESDRFRGCLHYVRRLLGKGDLVYAARTALLLFWTGLFRLGRRLVRPW